MNFDKVVLAFIMTSTVVLFMAHTISGEIFYLVLAGLEAICSLGLVWCMIRSKIELVTLGRP